MPRPTSRPPSEAGLPDFVSQIFFGIFAAIGTPKPILEQINEVTQKEWADKAFQKKLFESGFEPMLGYGPDRSDQYLRTSSPSGARSCRRFRGRERVKDVRTAQPQATPRHGPSMGRAVPRLEDAHAPARRGRFVDDIELPGLLHACFVRSPVAHARLTASTRRRRAPCPACARCSPIATCARISPATACRWRCRSPRSAFMSIRAISPRTSFATWASRSRWSWLRAAPSPRMRQAWSRSTMSRCRPSSTRATGSSHAAPKARLDCPDNLVAHWVVELRRRRGRVRARGASRIADISACTRAAAIRSRRAAWWRASTGRGPAHGLGFDPDAAQGEARAGRCARPDRAARCA